MRDLIRLPAPSLPALPLAAPQPEPLWREVTGRVLRRHRREREERLADTAARAGISIQYLSEVERGRKEPSSEILEAAGEALGLDLHELTSRVSESLASESAAPARSDGPVLLAA